MTKAEAIALLVGPNKLFHVTEVGDATGPDTPVNHADPNVEVGMQYRFVPAGGGVEMTDDAVATDPIDSVLLGVPMQWQPQHERFFAPVKSGGHNYTAYLIITDLDPTEMEFVFVEKEDTGEQSDKFMTHNGVWHGGD